MGPVERSIGDARVRTGEHEDVYLAPGDALKMAEVAAIEAVGRRQNPGCLLRVCPPGIDIERAALIGDARVRVRFEVANPRRRARLAPVRPDQRDVTAAGHTEQRGAAGLTGSSPYGGEHQHRETGQQPGTAPATVTDTEQESIDGREQPRQQPASCSGRCDTLDAALHGVHPVVVVAEVVLDAHDRTVPRQSTSSFAGPRCSESSPRRSVNRVRAAPDAVAPLVHPRRRAATRRIPWDGLGRNPATLDTNAVSSVVAG